MKKSFLVIGLFVGIDQISKIIARIMFTSDIEITPFFDLHLTQNIGVAFSLPFPQLFLIILTLGVLIVLGLILYRKNLREFDCIATHLVMAGAIGNLIDRVLFSSVTDFLSFWRFPIFNFADIFITFGVGFFLWQEIINSRKFIKL